MNKHLLTLALLSLFSIAGRAQSGVNSSGSKVTIGANTFEYAVGDVVAGATLNSASLVVTQGVLQPVQTTTGIHGTAIIAGLQVYPSPVHSTLYLQPDMGKSGTLKYQLYDAAGRLVMLQTAQLQAGNERQEADLHTLAAGQYLLQVQWQTGTGTSSSAYKIQKL